jgi:hypothetical protein
VEFAVGARYKERVDAPATGFECRLAAAHWPKRRRVFYDDRLLDLEARSAEAMEEEIE